MAINKVKEKCEGVTRGFISKFEKQNMKSWLLLELFIDIFRLWIQMK